MYERMLNKHEVPSFDDLLSYSGKIGGLWIDLDQYLNDTFSAVRLIRFPYGNKYGWGAKYSQKGKHICDVFAENGAFTAHFHISNNAMEATGKDLSDYAISIWESKYPCGNGGWLHFRVLNNEQLYELKKILCAKMSI